MKYILIIFSIWSLSTAYAQTKISNTKAQEDLTKNKDIQLLDVRTENEFNEKHIKNAINIDWKDQNNFETSVSKLDKSKPLYIYCRSGARSSAAAIKLTTMGFDVYDIEGGVLNWEANNLPLTQEGKKTDSNGMSANEYNQIIQNNDKVLFDFYADYCAPCKKLMPIIAKIEKKYTGQLKVVRIDVDQNKALIKTLGVKNLPTLILYKNGVKTWTSTGEPTKKTIEKQLKK